MTLTVKTVSQVAIVPELVCQLQLQSVTLATTALQVVHHKLRVNVLQRTTVLKALLMSSDAQSVSIIPQQAKVNAMSVAQVMSALM